MDFRVVFMSLLFAVIISITQMVFVWTVTGRVESKLGRVVRQLHTVERDVRQNSYVGQRSVYDNWCSTRILPMPSKMCTWPSYYIEDATWRTAHTLQLPGMFTRREPLFWVGQRDLIHILLPLPYGATIQEAVSKAESVESWFKPHEATNASIAVERWWASWEMIQFSPDASTDLNQLPGCVPCLEIVASVVIKSESQSISLRDIPLFFDFVVKRMPNTRGGTIGDVAFTGGRCLLGAPHNQLNRVQ